MPSHRGCHIPGYEVGRKEMNRDLTTVLLLAGGAVVVGYFLFAGRPAPPPPVHGLKGDLTDDGILSIADLVALELWQAGEWASPTLTDSELFWRADVNGDGQVDYLDYEALKLLITPVTPPVEPVLGFSNLEVRYVLV